MRNNARKPLRRYNQHVLALFPQTDNAPQANAFSASCVKTQTKTKIIAVLRSSKASIQASAKRTSRKSSRLANQPIRVTYARNTRDIEHHIKVWGHFSITIECSRST